MRATLLLAAVHGGTHGSVLRQSLVVFVVFFGVVLIILTAFAGAYGEMMFALGVIGGIVGLVIAHAAGLGNFGSVLVAVITAEGIIVLLVLLPLLELKFGARWPRAHDQWPTARARLRSEKVTERERKAARRQQTRERKTVERQRKEEEKRKRRLGL